jgi:hypothetical protein
VSDDFEMEDREPLRDTPEGELWTSVLVDAVEDLEGSVEWLRAAYPARRAELEQDQEARLADPSRWRERLRELERERRDRETQIESCTWFFNDPDSPLEFICDVLAYPIELIREHAQNSLNKGAASRERDLAEPAVAPSPEPAQARVQDVEILDSEPESEHLGADGGRALAAVAV